MSKSGFIRLFAGESKKIWAKKSAWVMGIILIAVILLTTLLVGALGDDAELMLKLTTSGSQSMSDALTGQQLNDSIPEGLYLAAAKKYLPQMEESLENQKQDLERLSGAERAVNYMMIAGLERQIQIVRYQVDHNIPRRDVSLCWSFVTLAAMLSTSLISLFSLIVGAGSVASEYSDGTIKLLIPRPYKRWKILLAKLLATLAYAGVLLLAGYLVSLLCGGALFGFGGGNTLVVGSNGTSAYAVSAFVNSFIIYFSGAAGLLVTIALAFMLSCLIRSRAVAVGVSMLITLVGGNIVNVLALLGQRWVKYTIFVNMDISSYFTTGTVIEGTGLLFTAVVMALYLALFLFVGFFTFQKRDI